jgi:Ca-activated chloride channel family protein
MIYWYWKTNDRHFVELQVPSVSVFHFIKRTWRQRLRHVLFAFRLIALSLIIVALARPQSTTQGEHTNTEGIDIMLATDISGSMLSEDLHPNRVEAAKQVASEFIDGRPNDRIGLVVFSGESFTQCPLTIDHAVVKNLLREIHPGMIEDGTAIGMGLATAVTRLQESTSKSRVIILLTDGVNNRGFIDPLTAAGIAQTYGVRVYTIGVGTEGMAPYPVQTPFGVQYQNLPSELDEDLLRKIAEETGGKYFRATDTEKLRAIFNEIDKLEKTKIEVTQFHNYKEEFYSAAMMGGLFLLLELGMAQTIFRKIP